MTVKKLNEIKDIIDKVRQAVEDVKGDEVGLEGVGVYIPPYTTSKKFCRKISGGKNDK